jgi:hypothetical protein
MDIKAVVRIEEKIVSLGTLKGGDVFRFAHVEYPIAITENVFFIVLEEPSKKEVFIANLFDGQCLIRDSDHRVVKHLASIHIESKFNP